MIADISVKYYDTTQFVGLSASATTYRHHQFPRHFHDHYTIQLIEEGVNTGFTSNENYNIGTGGLLLINPGELHAGQSRHGQNLKFHSIRLNEDFVRSFCNHNDVAIDSDVYFQNRPIYGSQAITHMKMLLADLAVGNHLSSEEQLNQFLMTILSSHTSESLKMPKGKIALNDARQFIAEHYHEEITLHQLADVCHLSPHHFLRQFKKQFGLTPFQYLRNIRIERAKELLNQHSITQTAHRTGFFDHSHFLRNFKKIEGIVPSDFIKSI